MNVVELNQARHDVSEMRRKRKLKSRLKLDRYRDLRPYATELLMWAKCKGGSKRILQELVADTFKVKVSADRIYRFVCQLNNGTWPNARNPKFQGENRDA